MVGYTKELKKLLCEAGCEFHRNGNGDHSIWKTPSGKSFTVDGNIKSRHTANKTLADAGLPKAF
jgi:hypothetical protein